MGGCGAGGADLRVHSVPKKGGCNAYLHCYTLQHWHMQLCCPLMHHTVPYHWLHLLYRFHTRTSRRETIILSLLRPLYS
jgi:hypothetical protein